MDGIDTDERVPRGLLRAFDALEQEAFPAELLSERCEDGQRIEPVPLVYRDARGQVRRLERLGNSLMGAKMNPFCSL